MILTTREPTRTGSLVYGPRAFEQDAQNAMRGDIVRGLIELITNADDAYARIAAPLGSIRVEVEHRRKGSFWRAIVRDWASGISQEEMEARLVELGGRVSGFEHGSPVRGNLGRGAKDLVAFGQVTYESIKDGQFASLRLLPNGRYEVPTRSRNATTEDRLRLGIAHGNGTVVTVRVRVGIVCPLHSTLRKRWASHYQLRDIVADPAREVLLVNLNNAAEQDHLTPVLPVGELLRSVALSVPGYPEAAARL